MRKSRSIDLQIMEALKRAEAGAAVPEVGRELRISSVPFCKCCSKLDGMNGSMMSRVKKLDTANARFLLGNIRPSIWAFSRCPCTTASL